MGSHPGRPHKDKSEVKRAVPLRLKQWVYDRIAKRGNVSKILQELAEDFAKKDIDKNG